MKDIIYLQKIGDLDESILITLRKNLKKIYKGLKIKFKIYPIVMPLSNEEYVSEKKKYKGRLIIEALINHFKGKPYFRVLGVMNQDVFTKGKDFVFGAALMPRNENRMGFISVIRLAEKFYRRSEDKKKFNLRVLKESIHELGHTFSLEHCNNLCVMKFSESLLDTDRKPAEYCQLCSKRLKEFISKGRLKN